ncbi:hypothetical protein SNEBB_003004 [Seison nebaliae]|nr:hypothetical protein SNEBB_003004 [Seison nebaliae]
MIITKYFYLSLLFVAGIMAKPDPCEKFIDLLPKCSSCRCGDTIEAGVECVPKCSLVQCLPGFEKYKIDECCDGCREI